MSDVSRILALGVASGSELLFDHIATPGAMWTGSGPRSVRHPVRFRGRFEDPPLVQVALSLIDADHGANLRLSLTADEITTEGFVVIAHTWSDTRIGRLAVAWVAFGEKAGEWDV